MRKTGKQVTAVILAASMVLGNVSAVFAENQTQETDYVVPKEGIKSIIADKEPPSGYEAENAVDGDTSTIWHSPWNDETTEGFPHYLIVEFEEVQQINTVWYQPRISSDLVQFINDYEFLVSDTDEGEFVPVEEERKWKEDGQNEVRTRFKNPVLAKRIKFLIKGHHSNTHDKFCTSVAELRFGMSSAEPEPDPSEKEILNIKAHAVSSENPGYKKEKAVDGDTSTFWHNEWQPQAPCPHWIEFDLNETWGVKELHIMPRQDQISGSRPMAITKYNLYVKDQAEDEYKLAVANGTLQVPKKGEYAKIQFSHGISARYLKLEVVEDASGINSAIAELKAFYDEEPQNASWEALLFSIADAKQYASGVSVGDDYEQYPQSEYQKYEEAIADAELLLNAPNAEVQEPEQMVSSLLKAKEEFKKTAKFYTKQDLMEKIEESRKLKEETSENDGPSEEEFAVLENAIDEAQAVLDSENSEPYQVHKEYKKLSAAYDRFYNKINKSVVDLSGQWNFKIGAYTSGMETGETVQLPGTMDENKKGYINNNYTDKTRLSPRYRYEGRAVYQKKITVPDNWEGQKITLTLERTRNTTVWLNDQKIGSSDALGVAQTFDLSGLDPKQENVLTVEVNNSDYASQTWKSHMVVEETQGNWNGIVGEISLKVQNPVYIDDIRIYPAKANEEDQTVNTARIQMDIGNMTQEDVKDAVVKVSAVSRNTEKPKQQVEEKEFPVELIESGEGLTAEEFHYFMGEDVYLWDEFDPALYDITVTLKAGDFEETQTVTTGMREYTHDGDHFIINGKKIFLRGEANCAVFPLTAYPPMEKEEWIELLSKAKSYGLNHYRFHSWSPSKAAYEAADELGMYLQPELYAFTGNPFQSEKQFYSDESKRIIKELANYPSFVSFTFGNEIFPSQADAVELTEDLRSMDNTRLYAAASNNLGASGGYYPGDSTYWDFWIAMYSDRGDREIRGSNGENGFINLEQPATTRTYYNALDGIEIPFVSHEIGQFQQYPDFSQIEKYTGVFEARNLEIAKKSLESKGMLEQNKEFAVASGKLAAICYRAEVEAALRTSNMGGYELLGLQDFPGQGSALVGILDAFMETKEGMPTGEEFSHYNSAVTALGLMEKYVWTNDEDFTAEYEIANYGSGDISVIPVWSLKRQDGTILAEGEGEKVTVKQGDLTSVCNIRTTLQEVQKAEKLSLEIGTKGNEVLSNQYDVWVYPSRIETKTPKDIMVVASLTEKAEAFLKEGGKVLVLPEIDSSSLPKSVNGNFTPTFWSGMWFPTTFNTMGFVTDEEHPIFHDFPTESHSNWQWWNLVKNSRPIILDDTEKSYRPIMQAIDNFGNDKTVDGAGNNRKLGLIFEGKVENGKVLVCSIDLLGVNKERPEAKQLYHSIIQYMDSEAFLPSETLGSELLNELIAPANMADGIAVNRTGEGYPKPFASYSLEDGNGKRLWKIVDGKIDTTLPNEAWTNWNHTGATEDYIGVEFNGVVRTDQINLYVYEDHGCKAPKAWDIQYLKDGEWVSVENAELLEKEAMTAGKNTVTFDPVTTSQIRIVMTVQEGMYLAVTEFDVQGTKVEQDFYQDVAADDWFHDAVYLMAEKNLMTGIVPNELFGANQLLPRAQFAEVLYRMSGEDKAEAEQKFQDVPEDAWYADAVAWAAKNKIVTGYADGKTFGPADPVTREQMAVMLYRYAQYKGYNLSASGDYSKFQDASKVSEFADAAMKWAVGSGIIMGKEDGTLLAPQGITLRCEGAVMVARALQIFED